MFLTMRRQIMLWVTLLFVGLFMAQNVQPVYALGDLNISINNGQLSTGDIGGIEEGAGLDNTWKTIFDKYKGVITGISGLALFTVILAFIINLVKLANAGTNTSARTAALQGLLWTGIATIGLGSVTTIVGIFYYMMDKSNG